MNRKMSRRVFDDAFRGNLLIKVGTGAVKAVQTISAPPRLRVRQTTCLFLESMIIIRK